MMGRLAVVASVLFALSCTRRQPVPGPIGEAHRIVSISPATTEALFAIGAGERVVGRSRFCDWPPEAARLPIVGGFVDADLEAVLQLRPDLVVGAPGPASTALADKLAARGIATWLPDTESLASIHLMILGLGARTGRAAEAESVERELETRERVVEESLAAEPIVRVLMVLDVSPVVAAGPKSFAGELIARARGVNVLDEGGAWQTLAFERVIELSPDVVVDASVDHAGGAARITPQVPGWDGVAAVRAGRVVALTDKRALRPGPRVAEGLAVLARAIHPGAHVPSW